MMAGDLASAQPSGHRNEFCFGGNVTDPVREYGTANYITASTAAQNYYACELEDDIDHAARHPTSPSSTQVVPSTSGTDRDW